MFVLAMEFPRSCAARAALHLATDFGGHGGGVTPVPIPNTEVKPSSADGTWVERPWESRTPPSSHVRTDPQRWGSFVVLALPFTSHAEAPALLLRPRQARCGPPVEPGGPRQRGTALEAQGGGRRQAEEGRLGRGRPQGGGARAGCRSGGRVEGVPGRHAQPGA